MSPTIRPLVLIASLLGTASLLAQGPLTPNSSLDPTVGLPNPLDGSNNPQPTMKTLHQVEPRATLESVATSDPNYDYIIDQPGSYYLTTNIFAFKTGCIQINAEGVTLDLNGFALWDIQDIAATAVEITSSAHRCVVKNGSIRDFTQAVKVTAASPACSGGSFTDLSVSGCTLAAIVSGDGWTIDRCRVSGCTSSGITAGNGSTVTRCAIVDNLGDGVGGIIAKSGCVVRDCAVRNNHVSFGIQAGSGTLVESCTVSENQGSTSLAYSFGILGADRNVIRGCSANANTYNGTGSGLLGAGIYAGGTTLVDSCVCSRNQGDGIICWDRSRITNNRSSGNGFNGNGAGIHAVFADPFGANQGFSNHIIGNSVSDNDAGLQIDSAFNFIAKNIVHSNPTSGAVSNFAIAAGNRVAPIVSAPGSAALSGFAPAGASLGTTDPWANIAY